MSGVGLGSGLFQWELHFTDSINKQNNQENQQMKMKTVSNKLTCLLGMHDRDFFQPILITDNHLCLMADTDKITDHLKRRS